MKIKELFEKYQDIEITEEQAIEKVGADRIKKYLFGVE